MGDEKVVSCMVLVKPQGTEVSCMILEDDRTTNQRMEWYMDKKGRDASIISGWRSGWGVGGTGRKCTHVTIAAATAAAWIPPMVSRMANQSWRSSTPSTAPVHKDAPRQSGSGAACDGTEQRNSSSSGQCLMSILECMVTRPKCFAFVDHARTQPWVG